MKPIALFFFAFILINLSADAQKKAPAKIHGSIPSLANKITELKNANTRFSQLIKVDKTGAFEASLPIDTGYYTFNKATIYLEPGANLEIRQTDSIPVFKNKTAAENNLLISFRTMINNYLPFKAKTLDETYALEPADLIGRMDKYKRDAYEMLNNKALSPYFQSTQKKQIDYNIKAMKYAYVLNYGVDQKKRKELLSSLLNSSSKALQKTSGESLAGRYAATITKRLPIEDRNLLDSQIWDDFDINDEILYTNSKEYTRLFQFRLTQLISAEKIKFPRLKNVSPDLVKIETAKNNINNAYIREAIFYDCTRSLLRSNKDQDKQTYYNDYIAIAKDSLNKSLIQKTYTDQLSTVAGLPAPEFQYKDHKGQLVSSSSLKGKYLYIDIWATWCVPCIREIPALKEIQKKYEGKNIDFVSISIDTSSDTEKWKKFISTNALQGIQLIADKEWGSDFIKKFGINSIPRFILIDPQGNIVKNNAERPSNPALIKTLDQLIN